MVLILPYRPLVGAIRQENPYTATSQPGNITVAGVDSRVDLYDIAPPANRTLAYEDDFSVGYENRFPNRTAWLLSTSGGNTVNRNYTTLNGNGAVTLTWPAGSDTAVRHHLTCNMVGGPYSEFFFTQEVRWENNYVHGPLNQQQGTQKFISIRGTAGAPTPCSFNPCPTNKWNLRLSSRQRLSGGIVPGPIPLGKVSMERYFAYPNQPVGCAHESLFSGGFLDTGTTYSFEWHWKQNSAPNVADGFVTIKVNDVNQALNTDVGRSASYPPLPENFYWYCTGTSASNANTIGWEFFYGGSGSGWAPYQNSAFTLGYWKLEIPS